MPVPLSNERIALARCRGCPRPQNLGCDALIGSGRRSHQRTRRARHCSPRHRSTRHRANCSPPCSTRSKRPAEVAMAQDGPTHPQTRSDHPPKEMPGLPIPRTRYGVRACPHGWVKIASQSRRAEIAESRAPHRTTPLRDPRPSAPLPRFWNIQSHWRGKRTAAHRQSGAPPIIPACELHPARRAIPDR